MREHVVQIRDAVAVELADGGTTVRLSPGAAHVCPRDLLDLRAGLVSVFRGEVELVREEQGALRIECGETSVASSCSRTSEMPTIERFAARLRELLEGGGCCGGPLTSRKMLERVLENVFREADRLHGPGAEIPPEGTAGREFAENCRGEEPGGEP